MVPFKLYHTVKYFKMQWRNFMNAGLTRDEAIKLLKKYNREPFHLLHALTVEGVMRWYAKDTGNEQDIEFWGLAGLLHDIDFEQFPDQHCEKAADILREAHASEDLIHAVCCHGYGICCDIEPIHQMEKVLYAVDELTGLIGACVKMRPSKSCCDMEVSSLKKKFKDMKFAAGCSRDVIRRGAQMLGWKLDELFEKTILAMQSCEVQINDELSQMQQPLR
jgi:predicted hydrolase (HD superfamily)